MAWQRCITVSLDENNVYLNDKINRLYNITMPREHAVGLIRSFCVDPYGCEFVFSSERTEDNKAKKCVLDI